MLAAAGTLAAAALAQDTAAPPPGEAERLVFMSPHLARIEPPRTLHYRYLRQGGGEARLDDEASMALTHGAAGCCSVRGRYLSGEHALALPDIEQAVANPVVLYFLEHQVRLLQRRTGGSANHFRRRIRQAMVEAPVDAATIRWGGRELPARTVRITPFVDDPYRARFERDAEAQYVFTLSDAVPGAVFELRASLPGADASVQTLTLAEPASPASDKR